MNCSTRSRAKRNSSSSEISKTASVAASTRTRNSSLAAISTDSARSNAESMAQFFTGAELNQRKRVLEADSRPIGGAPARPVADKLVLDVRQWPAGAPPLSLTLRRLSASGTAASAISVSTQKGVHVGEERRLQLHLLSDPGDGLLLRLD